jgi:hypothetical protein
VSRRFVGDYSGVLHVGRGQVALVQEMDEDEFPVNVYVYPGGTLILPAHFTCYNVQIVVW